jgi:hypothetical protein
MESMRLLPVDFVVRARIRKITVVVDTQDALAPEMTVEDFHRLFGREPDQPRYRVFHIEVITSPDDHQPMLVSECGRYGRFLRREADNVYFRKTVG